MYLCSLHQSLPCSPDLLLYMLASVQGGSCHLCGMGAGLLGLLVPQREGMAL